MKKLSLCTALVLTQLLSTSAQAAPAAQPAPGLPGVQPATTPVAPTRQRLSMRLEVLSTTDHGSGNTEDEVYYALAALPYTRGANVRQQVVHRTRGNRDIWEMGPRSAPTLQRILFEGKSSPIAENRFMLVVAEQDSVWKEVLETILSAGLLTFTHAVNGDYDDADEAAQVVARLQGAFKAVAQRIASDDDDIIGAVTVTMKGERLSVAADAALFSKVIDASPVHPVVELSGAGGTYRVRFFIDDAAEPRPVVHDFIGLEDDDCGGGLWIETASGNIQLGKGKRAGFVPQSNEWRWFCDGDDNRTVADAATDFVIASRASEGREILWRTFDDDTPGPDLTW